MIHFNGLPEAGEGAREILEEHLNDMLLLTTQFAVGFLGRVPASQLPFEKKDLPEMRALVCPPHVGKDRKRKKLILGALTKLRSPQFEMLDASEKYFLARVCSAAFINETNVIERLVDAEMEEELALWMNNYRIKDEKMRKAVISSVRGFDAGKWDETAYSYLRDKGDKFKDAVMKTVGEPAILQFEFPSAIYMFMNNQEMQILADLQPETVGKAG